MTQAALLPDQRFESLPIKLRELVNYLEYANIITPINLTRYLQGTAIQTEDLLPWADWKHPIRDSYGRRLVYRSDRFEVMVMSWLPGDYSAIHDHGATQWGAVLFLGTADHITYQFEGGVLKTAAQQSFTPGSVNGVDQKLIHQMGNPSDEPFLSLHVYGCHQACDAITGNARLFDLHEGTIQYTDGGVFFCLPESEIKARTYGICGDRSTTLRHHQQMGDRIHRILAQETDPALTSKLTQLRRQIERLKATTVPAQSHQG